MSIRRQIKTSYGDTIDIDISESGVDLYIRGDKEVWTRLSLFDVQKFSELLAAAAVLAKP